MRVETKQLKQGAQALKRVAAALNLRRPEVTITPSTNPGADTVLTLTLGDYHTTAALTIPGDDRETLLPAPVAVNLGELIAALGTDKGSVRLSAPDAETLGLTFDNGDTVTLSRADNPHPALEPFGLGRVQAIELDRFAEVARVASSDGARPILTALAILEQGQTLAATDSYRLRSAELGAGNGITGPEGTPAPDTLLPAALIIAAARFSASGYLQLGEGFYRITAGHSLTITGRPINGDFPNFRQLFPENPDGVLLNGAELGAVLKRIIAAAKASGHKADTVPAVLTFGADYGAVIVTGAGVTGSATIALGEYPNLEPLTVGLNPAYLAEMVDASTGYGAGTWFSMGFSGNLKPVIFTGVSTLALLMPVRIAEPVTA